MPCDACDFELTPSAVQLLAMTSLFILSSKVRSRALLFLYKLFFQLVYHAFYRNLVSSKSDTRPCLRGITRIIGLAELVQFARLRSPSQFATVQLLSSISVVIIFPLQMTKIYHRSLQILIGYPSTWEDHVDNVASSFYCRGLAQNVTMLGFLGKYRPPFQRGLSVNGFQAGSQSCISVQMLVRPSATLQVGAHAKQRSIRFFGSHRRQKIHIPFP